MFAKKEPAALRRRLAEIDRDVKLGKLDFANVSAQAAEILVALKRLGEPLAPKEEAFLAQNKSVSLAEFDRGLQAVFSARESLPIMEVTAPT